MGGRRGPFRRSVVDRARWRDGGSADKSIVGIAASLGTCSRGDLGGRENTRVWAADGSMGAVLAHGGGAAFVRAVFLLFSVGIVCRV